MKRAIPLLLAATVFAGTPAAAQHAGHHMPGMSMPMPPAKPATKKKPAAKKAAPKKPSARKPAPSAARKKAAPKRANKPSAKRAPARAQANPHAAHDMPARPGMAKPAQSGDPHAGHQLPAGPELAADPHAGHKVAEQPAGDPHAGHDMSSAAVEVPVGPPPAEALSGPENAADVAWGRSAMAPGRSVLFGEHGGMSSYKLLVDQFETRIRSGRDGYLVNAEGWYGGDIDKLWLKAELEGGLGRKPEQLELQALWSHAIDPWFDVQTGVRLDGRPDRRARLVAGVQGLAPYWIEVDAAAFLSDKGDVTARLEAEHDVRVTRKLILQPRAELDFSLQDIPRERVGAGLSGAELGLRLRYQVTQTFAPYVGVAYERAFGGTRRLLREEAEEAASLNLVAGLRTWF